MVRVSVATAVFTEKINRYQQMTGKAMGEVVSEQAKLLAVRLTQLTFPKTASIGKKRVAIDIGKVYLQNRWFEDVFQFRNAKLGERVKDAVRSKDTSAVEAIFENSPKLRRIEIKPFDKSAHARLRKDGRITIPNPNNFPLADQGKVKAYENEKKKNVGMAKSGWASAAAALGKEQPSWLSKPGTGSVENHSAAQENPYIIISNNVSFFSRLDARANIVSRALEGRAVDMIKSAENALRRAARATQLAG